MEYDDTSLSCENWSREKLLEEFTAMAERANYYEHKFTEVCANAADERRDADRRAYARYHDDKIRNARLYTDQLIGESLIPVNALIYQVQQLGDRAGTAQVRTLKATAERAERRVRDARPNITDHAQRAWDRWRAQAAATGAYPPI